MASYQQTCMHCNSLIDRDARFCPFCGSQSPFGYLCPACLLPIKEGQTMCSGCGRRLYVICPRCSSETFVQERCEKCGQSLMVFCQNKRCGVLQFFEKQKMHWMR